MPRPCYKVSLPSSGDLPDVSVKNPAKLDLSKPGESWAKVISVALRRGVIGVRSVSVRDSAALFIAVRWLIGKKRERFSVVTISLTEHAVSWRKYQSGRAAKAALAD